VSKLAAQAHAHCAVKPIVRQLRPKRMAHTGPFLGTEARVRGMVTRRTLRSRHDQVYRDVYVPKGEKLTPVTRAVAAWLWSGRLATAAGFSASALYGTQWIDHELPAELYRRNGKPVDGILIHRDELFDDEVQLAQGIPATTPARTAFDLGRRGRRTPALIAVDALANATRLLPSDVTPLVERHRGARGVAQLREIVNLMDNGAESPQETRTRLLLVDAGLPRPQTQIVVGRWRIDMGWEEFKVGVEYDGPQHWTDPSRRTRDIDKYADLDRRRWRMVRVNDELLRYRRHEILVRTCEALRAAGAEWPVIARVLG
jgi:very-short-patch-repair endonuclease